MINKKLLFSATLLLLALSVYSYRYFNTPSQNNAAAGAAAPVGVATVIERNVTKWDDFSGTLTAADQVDIRPRVAGTIEAIHFEDGQLVQKGQALFTIDRKPYEVELAKAQAAVNAAKAQAAYAKAVFERSEKLVTEKVISTQEFDSAQQQYSAGEANVKMAEAAYKQAQLNLEYTNITSPISGRVSRAEITVGNLVNSGGDAPILTRVVSLDPIYADFDADEQTFLNYMHINDNNPENLKKIEVKLGLAGTQDFPYTGSVKSFDNSLNTHAGTIRVRAIFANPKGSLIPGLFARVRISGSGNEKALLISERSIGTDQNKKFVLVVGADNKTAYREIVPGAVIDGLRLIEKGLNPGERIVVTGLQRTHPGSPVIPETVPMDDTAAEKK